MFSRSKRRKQSGNRKGAASVEAAIMLPILIIVSVGATDVAQYINLAQSVTNASRQGSRFACRDTTENVDQVESAIRTYFQQSFPNTSVEVLIAAVEVEITHVNGNSINGGDLTEVESGNPILVEVDFDFDVVRWFKGFDYLGSEVRQSSTIGRRE